MMQDVERPHSERWGPLGVCIPGVDLKVWVVADSNLKVP